jgi:hypothetical protein
MAFEELNMFTTKEKNEAQRKSGTVGASKATGLLRASAAL